MGMSKNFELVYGIGQTQGSLAAESISPFDVSALLDEKCADHATARPRKPSHPEIRKLVNLLFLSAADAPHYVLFCGVGESDRSGRVCVSVARVLATEVSSRVCLVDAKILGAPFHSLLDVVDEGVPASDSIEIPSFCGSQIDRNLWFISAEQLCSLGGPAAGAVQMCAGLLHLRQVFGYLVVHAAPLGNDTVASVVGQATDGAVLVLDADNTRRVAARNAKQTLEAARVPLLGTVLNDRTFPIPEKLYRRL
jgi:Mrp family chromosome partitioning ATPase